MQRFIRLVQPIIDSEEAKFAKKVIETTFLTENKETKREEKRKGDTDKITGKNSHKKQQIPIKTTKKRDEKRDGKRKQNVLRKLL